jgi:hypothetical protein
MSAYALALTASTGARFVATRSFDEPRNAARSFACGGGHRLPEVTNRLSNPAAVPASARQGLAQLGARQ